MKWRGDGKEIYYQSMDGKIMAATVQTGPQGVQAETPRELFAADFSLGQLREFDVASDGQRFLLILNTVAGKTTTRLTVVSNRQAALRK